MMTSVANDQEDDCLTPIRRMLRACIQCGTCTGSCPNAFAMDHSPRKLWRMVQLGIEEEIFASRTFSLCSSCYTCTLRCPRGLELTAAMAGLKAIATQRDLSAFRPSGAFYRQFLESVRRHGRVREMEFMTLYFVALKNPWLPLRFAPLGIKLIRKGKVSLQLPSRGRGKLAAVFEKVHALETRS